MAEESETPVFDTIAARRSIRSFADAPVEEKKLMNCLEAARLAPSWADKQCWHFVLVQGADRVYQLGIVPKFIKNTQALVVACGDPDRSGNVEGKQYYLVDVAIAVEHLVLAAWEQGLGTVWVGAFREDKVRQALGIPPEVKVVALIPIGYPADKETIGSRLIRRIAGSAERKEMKEILHTGRW